MGYLITDPRIVKLLQFTIQSSDLPLNTYSLAIKLSKCYYIGGMVITSGGTVPLSAGSFVVNGDTSGASFLRVTVDGIAGTDVLYQFDIQATGQAFTPQTAETYSLNWTYVAGDVTTQVIIAYIEYS